jgi:hypothetical protein
VQYCPGAHVCPPQLEHVFGTPQHSPLAILLKLRRTTSQTLQGAPPGCDSPRMPPLASCTPSRIVLENCAPKSPIDRTMRPAVAKKTPIESRLPTIVLQGPSASKKVCASWVMPTIVSGKKGPTIRPMMARAPAFERAVARVVGWGSGTGRAFAQSFGPLATRAHEIDFRPENEQDELTGKLRRKAGLTGETLPYTHWMDGCEVRLCDPCARVRPCVPCVSRVSVPAPPAVSRVL